MSSDTKKLYAMAARLGLLERDSEEDAFHQLVYGLTKKEHVSELNTKECKKVYDELEKRLKLHESSGEMATVKQKRYIEILMKKLVLLDPSETELNERLAGVVRKEIKISSSPSEPLRWVKKSQASKLIEQLKRYVKSAEKKAENK